MVRPGATTCTTGHSPSCGGAPNPDLVRADGRDLRRSGPRPPPDGWEQDARRSGHWSPRRCGRSHPGLADKGRRDWKRVYQTKALVTGYDIIYFWVARMLGSGPSLAADGRHHPQGARGRRGRHRLCLHGLIVTSSDEDEQCPRAMSSIRWRVGILRRGRFADSPNGSRAASSRQRSKVGEDDVRAYAIFGHQAVQRTRLALLNGAEWTRAQGD